MSNWFVYIVECADHTYYVGVSTDVAKRVEAHNRGRGAKYTKGRCPVRVVYAAPFPDKSAALKREYELKQLTRAEKLKFVASYGQID